MHYSFLYELPSHNHKDEKSGVLMRVDAYVDENDFVKIECTPLDHPYILNRQQCEFEMAIITRFIQKREERERRQEEGERILNELFTQDKSSPNAFFTLILLISFLCTFLLK
jgi:hypothetical protein